MHSEGILAGELKHGPLAMIDNTMPIVMIIMDDMVKTVSYEFIFGIWKAVSHIPQFGDATKSPTEDAASPVADRAVYRWPADLKSRPVPVPSLAGDLLASPSFGICDSTRFE